MALSSSRDGITPRSSNPGRSSTFLSLRWSWDEKHLVTLSTGSLHYTPSCRVYTRCEHKILSLVWVRYNKGINKIDCSLYHIQSCMYHALNGMLTFSFNA